MYTIYSFTLQVTGIKINGKSTRPQVRLSDFSIEFDSSAAYFQAPISIFASLVVCPTNQGVYVVVFGCVCICLCVCVFVYVCVYLCVPMSQIGRKLTRAKNKKGKNLARSVVCPCRLSIEKHP